MTRKESEKDADRIHYYSQFWLDVAAGRRIIGAPKPEDESADSDVLESILPLRKSVRSVSYDDSSDSQFDEQDERIVHPVAEPLATPEEFGASDLEEIDLETDDDEIPDIEEEVVDDMDIPDMDLSPAAAEEEEESEEEEEETAAEASSEEVAEDSEGESTEEEEEEDIGWGGRSRKRNKPVRPKAPPKKAPRREPRRGY